MLVATYEHQTYIDMQKCLLNTHLSKYSYGHFLEAILIIVKAVSKPIFKDYLTGVKIFTVMEEVTQQGETFMFRFTNDFLVV